MKKVCLFMGFLIAVVLLPFSVYADSHVPNIEKEWQMVNSKMWRMGSPEVGYFSVGTNSLYRSPDGSKHGVTLSFVGNDEVVLRAWWSGPEKTNDMNSVEFAVKDEKGEWVSGISGQGVGFEAALDDNGNIPFLFIFLLEPAGAYPAGTLIRTIAFSSPLKPEK